jgi:hypothetical protein
LAAQDVETALDAYAQETVPPVPAVAENDWGCIEKEAVTTVLEAPRVTIVGEVAVGVQALPVHVQPEKM